MKKINQYTDPGISEKELDDLTGELLQAKFYGEKKQEWAQELKAAHGIERGGAILVKMTQKSSRRLLLLAASVALLITSWLLLRPNQSPANELAAQLFQQEKLPTPQVRKGLEDSAALQLAATDAYLDGNFAKAIEAWNQLERQQPLDAESQYFKGLCHLKLGQAQLAASSFRQVKAVAETQPKFQQEATWFLALSYSMTSDFERAMPHLRQVIKDDWRTEQATKLMEQLEREQIK